MASDYLWIYVTNDEYELPIFVADTCAELARMLGKDEQAIRSAMCHAEKRGQNSRYKRVRKDNESDGED